MTRTVLLGPWIRRFLLEHLVSERNLSRNTQQSYRDTLRLFLPYLARQTGKAIDRLNVEDLSDDRTRGFLKELEEKRRCRVSTRNQRLAAIHSLAHFIGRRSPEHVSWCGTIKSIPFKKASRPMVSYLEKEEMDAVLDAPNRDTVQGRRDAALLLFLYNTGARADEAAQVRIADLTMTYGCHGTSFVVVRGKGDKLRRCPLWKRTTKELRQLIDGRRSEEHLFLNRLGQPLTRFGIHTLVKRHAAVAAASAPTLKNKNVGPHIIRHTTATHLLRAGVDINTIRAWLGHVSLSTTNVYAEVDLNMKAKAIAHCDVGGKSSKVPWKKVPDLMDFLRAL